MVLLTSTAQFFLLTIVTLVCVSESTHASVKNVTDAAPHTNITIVAPIKLPPIISSRVRPVSVPGFKVDLLAETQSISANKQWFEEHGGSYKNLTKRGVETVGGLTMDLPENVPPTPQSTRSKSSSVYIAGADLQNDLKFHAALSATAYCRGVVPLGRWNCRNCRKYVPDGKLLVTFSSLISDSNGYVLRSDAKETIYLVFRGTNSIRNAITDLTFFLTNYPPVKDAKVHVGFLASYNEIVRLFFPRIQKELTMYPNYKLVITGHSMGGAQAVLAGLDFYQRDKRFTPKNLSIYTVGCPRIGNPDFAYYVDSTGISVHRSVNDRDIVPHLPPQAVGFLHPGVEAWSLSKKVSQICASNIETKECSNSIVPFTSILDHLSIYGINEGLCL
ncbi:lipase precursor [Thamnidium elegans]|nr:lipase precursor [Thamnidium elegans]